MRVFISWSGATSKQIASSLKEWLPNIINDVEPWTSDEDIAKGAHWPSRLGRELQESKFGIICLTPTNLNEPWLLFEAGALSKTIDQARVCPYLFQLDPSTVRPPLGHFQASKANHEDTKRLLQSINAAVEEANGRALNQHRLEAAFEKWWPDFEERLREIPAEQPAPSTGRSVEEVAVEILETVRGLARDIPAAMKVLEEKAERMHLPSVPVWPHTLQDFLNMGKSGKTSPLLSALVDNALAESIRLGDRRLSEIQKEPAKPARQDAGEKTDKDKK